MAMKPAGSARHTPGPWRASITKVYATVDESDYLIADALGDRRFTFDERLANAELIAGAPELLRLLQAAHDALRLQTSGARVQEIADAIEPVLKRHVGAVRDNDAGKD